MLTSNKDAFSSCLRSNRCSKQRDSLFTHPTGKAKRLYDQCGKPGFASASTHLLCLLHQKKLCAGCKTELHIIVIIYLFGVPAAFFQSKWMTTALRNLPLYVSISDVTASQSGAGVNQQPSYYRGETQPQKLQTHAREDLGFVFCFAPSNWKFVFSEVSSNRPEALQHFLLSARKKKLSQQIYSHTTVSAICSNANLKQ